MNAREEFARTQRARERLAPDDPADSKLARREAELLRVHRDDWQVNDFRDVFRRGAVVEVTLDATSTPSKRRSPSCPSRRRRSSGRLPRRCRTAETASRA